MVWMDTDVYLSTLTMATDYSENSLKT